MLQNIAKYALESLAIALCAKYVLKRSNYKEVILMTISVMATLLVLDMFAPNVAAGTRQGAGFGLGGNLVQAGGSAHSDVREDYYKNNRNPKKQIPMFAHYAPIDGPETNEKLVSEGSAECGNELDKLTAAHANQTTIPEQVNVIERFMDDRQALNYYGNDRQVNVHAQDQSQTGGAASGAAIEPFSNQSIYDNYTSGPGQTAGERGLVYGNIKVEPTQEHLDRIKSTLYSGDLLNIETSTKRLSLPSKSKFVRGTKLSLANMDNNLFKLRFELVNGHGTTKMKPIKYGEGVYIVFNDENAQNKKLNHNGDLNTMKNERDTIFEIVNAANVASTEVVNMTDDVLIRRSVEGEDLRYLKVNSGSKSKVSTVAKKEEGSKFRLKSIKGCGPLWRFDSDTRTSNLFNPSQVRELVFDKTKTLQNEIQSLKDENEKLKSKANAVFGEGVEEESED